VTPRRTIAVALLTFVAVVASPFTAAVITGLLVEGCPCPSAGGDSSFAHALWHLLWAVLTLAVALGVRRFRRAWHAPGLTGRDPTLRLQSSPRGSTALAPNLLSPVRAFGEKQYQLLAIAQLLALASAAGQFLASAGANFIDVRSLNAPPHEGYFTIVHAAGEVLALVSLGMLLVVCLHMLGVGVRGALRPAAHPS
jgi:hypothetical protein